MSQELVGSSQLVLRKLFFLPKTDKTMKFVYLIVRLTAMEVEKVLGFFKVCN